MVFAKKKYPDNWEEKLLEGARNYIVYDNIWGDEKVKQKIKAYKKDTAGHTCSEEPINSMCVKSECLKRKFGVASDKVKKFPTLSALIKINHVPDPEFRFTVHYNDKVEGETTQQIIARDINYIMDQEKLRRLIGAHTPVPPPRIKGDDMQTVLDTLWQGMKIEKAPPGTSPKEILHKHLEGPDRPLAADQEQVARDVVAGCVEVDLPIALEPLFYGLDPSDDRPSLIVETRSPLRCHSARFTQTSLPRDANRVRTGQRDRRHAVGDAVGWRILRRLRRSVHDRFRSRLLGVYGRAGTMGRGGPRRHISAR